MNSIEFQIVALKSREAMHNYESSAQSSSGFRLLKLPPHARLISDSMNIHRQRARCQLKVDVSPYGGGKSQVWQY
jgi:hypothetical protein